MSGTDWAPIHERVVEQFRTGWDKPDPHAWDGFLGEQMEFVQPMLRRGTGPRLWWEEAARTLALVPDLRAAELVRRPAAWLRWWRSGVGPLLARRRLLRAVTTTPGGTR